MTVRGRQFFTQCYHTLTESYTHIYTYVQLRWTSCLWKRTQTQGNSTQRFFSVILLLYWHFLYYTSNYVTNSCISWGNAAFCWIQLYVTESRISAASSLLSFSCQVKLSCSSHDLEKRKEHRAESQQLLTVDSMWYFSPLQHLLCLYKTGTGDKVLCLLSLM